MQEESIVDHESLRFEMYISSSLIQLFMLNVKFWTTDMSCYLDFVFWISTSHDLPWTTMVSTSYILLNYKQIFINVLLPGVCDLNLHLPWTTMVSISYILLNYKKISQMPCYL